MSASTPSRSSDYNVIASAFDAVAATYDQMYGPAANAVMSWMRTENVAILKVAFPTGSNLLEIGCGTGEEAIELAYAGRRVLATDVSPSMIERTNQKIAVARLQDVITTQVLPAARVVELADHRPFDGAYASFGVLNAEPDIAAFAEGLAQVLPEGAAFVASVMSKVCLWELGWYALHLKPRRALRRWRNWHPTPVGKGHSVPTHFYAPHKLAAYFQPAFRVERILALPLLLPPPYLDSFFKRHVHLFERLEAVERRLRPNFLFNAIGDHFVLVLRRV